MQLRKILKGKRRQYFTYCVVIAACCPGLTQAGPQNGFGAYGGVIDATESGLGNSKGLSAGADAQFAINDHWSLNPYLMVSAERNSSSNTVTDPMAGLQVRHWSGKWFVGGQVFIHDRLIFGNGNTQKSAYGAAPGVLAGFEYPGGWGAEIQTDSFESTNTTGIRRNALRLHLTYRWH